MVQFKPFKGIRPKPELAEEVSSLPYDVMNREEAKTQAKGNPFSFLHVTRAEIDLDDTINAYDQQVYKKARKNLDQMIENGTLVQDSQPKFYIYRQMMWGRVQTGIVGCASIEDYSDNLIKKHEHTRVEKEIDRINHFDYCSAHTEPVFLTYKKSDKLNAIINNWIKFNKPVYDFKSDDGICHVIWDVSASGVNKKIEACFNELTALYIADGHHRSASSVKVGLQRRKLDGYFTGDEEYNYFLAVAFPDEDLFIMDYNRLVKDLSGTQTNFLSKVQEKFDLQESEVQIKPTEKHTFGMYLNKKWYKLTAKKDSYNADNIIESLDVSILQNNLLNPVLGIEDPRTDKRIDFVGGIRGLEELENRAKNDMQLAFSMYPTTIEDLMLVADSGMVMPPKSTWFEPKLRSGLFIHRF